MSTALKANSQRTKLQNQINITHFKSIALILYKEFPVKTENYHKIQNQTELGS